MRVTNTLPDMQYEMQQSQQALATAEEQLATGLRVNQLSDDPTASAEMIGVNQNAANVDQYTSNLNVVSNRMQTADSALSSAVSSLNSAISLGTQGANGTNTAADRQSVAQEVQEVLSSVVGLANTNYQGSYLFAGSNSGTAPFVAASETYTSAQGSASSPLATTTALTAGSVTTISDATTGETFTFKAAAGNTIATLQSAISNAVSGGTLSSGVSATIDSSGQLSISTNSSDEGIVASSNDAALGGMNAASGTSVANAYAYVGNDTVNNVQVGDSLTVPTNLPGNKVFTQIVSALSGLISSLQSGGTDQIGAATNAVTSALKNLSTQRIPFDNTISQLNSQESYLGQEKVTLTSEQTSLVGISTQDAATNLSQAELDNNTVLAAAAKAMQQTLLNYLQQ